MADPILGAEMRMQQRAVDGFVKDFERRRAHLTNTEPLLQRRRKVAPMPWDE